MKQKIAELRLKMEGYLGTARNVIDKAIGEQRSLTDAEKTDVDGLKGKAAAIRTTLDAYGEIRDIQEEASKPLTRAEKPAGENGNVRHEAAPGEFRALTREQRFYTPGQDDEGLSWGRAIRGMLLGDWRGAENERRSMSESTGGVGGWNVGSGLSSMVIDIARNQSALVRSGALTMPMENPEETVVKILTDPTPMWRGENAGITESDLGFAPLKLKAVALGCLCRVSLELLEDAKAFSTTVEQAIGAAIALELDRAGLFGTGAGEPRGLWNTDGVNNYSMGANGATLTNYDPFSYAVEYVSDYNGTAGAVIYSPRTAGSLDRLKDTTNQPLAQPESFKSLRKFATNQVGITQTQGTSTDASAAFVGDFTKVLIGIRSNVTIEASRVAGTDTFAKMQALIRGYIRADIAVLRPNNFTLIKGIR